MTDRSNCELCGEPMPDGEATYIVCQRCGDSRVVCVMPEEHDPEPMEVIEQTNVLAFHRKAS